MDGTVDGTVDPLKSATPTQRPGRPGGKRDLNRRRQTKAIADAALGLFLSRGIEPVAIGEITADAGVAKGSFYRYFKDKEALVEAVISPLATEVFEAMDRCNTQLVTASTLTQVTDAFQALAMHLLPALLSHREACRLYLLEARAPLIGVRAPIRRVADGFANRAFLLTTTAQRAGVLQKIPPAVSSLAVVGAVERLLLAFLDGDDLGPVHEIPGAVVSLIMEGLASSLPSPKIVSE